MNEVVVKDKAPLDELMLAMDVVDTLRHKELVLARELTAEDRDAKLRRSAARDLHEPRHRRHGRDPATRRRRAARGALRLSAAGAELLAHAGARVRHARALGQVGRRRRRGARRRGDRVSAVRARAGAARKPRKCRPSSRRRSRRSTRTPTTRPRSTPRARSSRRARPPSRRAISTPRARPRPRSRR